MPKDAGTKLRRVELRRSVIHCLGCGKLIIVAVNAYGDDRHCEECRNPKKRKRASQK